MVVQYKQSLYILYAAFLIVYHSCIFVSSNVLEPLVSPSILPRVSFIERMVAVHQFMKDHNLGKGLLKRIDDYFELLWHQSK